MSAFTVLTVEGDVVAVVQLNEVETASLQAYADAHNPGLNIRLVEADSIETNLFAAQVMLDEAIDQWS